MAVGDIDWRVLRLKKLASLGSQPVFGAESAGQTHSSERARLDLCDNSLQWMW